MQPVIRKATRKDVQTLAEVVRGAFRDVAERFNLTAENCPRHPSNCSPDWIEADFARGKQYFLLEIDRRPAGCVAIAAQGPHVGTIERLSVLPEARGRGCGHMLLLHALESLRELGLIRAQLAIVADHADLREWYERRGFVVTRREQFANLPFCVAILERDI